MRINYITRWKYIKMKQNVTTLNNRIRFISHKTVQQKLIHAMCAWRVHTYMHTSIQKCVCMYVCENLFGFYSVIIHQKMG